MKKKMMLIGVYEFSKFLSCSLAVIKEDSYRTGIIHSQGVGGWWGEAFERECMKELVVYDSRD